MASTRHWTTDSDGEVNIKVLLLQSTAVVLMCSPLSRLAISQAWSQQIERCTMQAAMHTAQECSFFKCLTYAVSSSTRQLATANHVSLVPALLMYISHPLCSYVMIQLASAQVPIAEYTQEAVCYGCQMILFKLVAASSDSNWSLGTVRSQSDWSSSTHPSQCLTALA